MGRLSKYSIQLIESKNKFLKHWHPTSRGKTSNRIDIGNYDPNLVPIYIQLLNTCHINQLVDDNSRFNFD